MSTSELETLQADYVIDYDQNGTLSTVAKRFGDKDTPGDDVHIHYEPTTNPHRLFARLMLTSSSTGTDLSTYEVAADMSNLLDLTSYLIPQMPTVWFNEQKAPNSADYESFYMRIKNSMLTPSPTVGILYNYVPPQPTSGYIDVIYGNEFNSTDTYSGMLDFWYKFNYGILFLTADQLNSMPDGAVIESFSFENETGSENGTVTFVESKITVTMAEAPSSFTQLPENLRINLTSGTDASWNSSVTPVLIDNDASSTPHSTVVTGRNWEPTVVLKTPWSYTPGNNLILSLNSATNDYVGGALSNPKWYGQVLSGTNHNRIFCRNATDSGQYLQTAYVNYDNTFRPNIRVNWKQL